MFSARRSQALRGAEYERVLRALAMVHAEASPGLRFWSDGPVMGFAERLIAALGVLVEGSSFGSISVMPDVRAREYKLLASARLASQEQRVVNGLNAKLASLVRAHEGYQRMQDGLRAGHVLADVDVMTRRGVTGSCPWREIYEPRNAGFSTVFTMTGATMPYWVAIFRNENPIVGREVKMLDLFRTQLLRYPAAMRRIERLDGKLSDNAAQRLVALGLRPSEAEVLRWVCEGKRDSEIAVILGKSVRTVNTQVMAVLRTLRVETRTAAAAVAMEHLSAIER